ncbi:hypothetical protein PG997_011440 [Apiospora hydei]|uniref:Uncharacterized protein n=1 Tax=Apiospora hydei TaxID=1337664 RepID=A0ABR1VJ25_9PEZI
MCQYYDYYHTYLGCIYADPAHDPNDVSPEPEQQNSEEEATNQHHDEADRTRPAPQRSVFGFQFLNRNASRPDGPVEMSQPREESVGGGGIVDPPKKPQHKIREVRIIQCPEALEYGNQNDPPQDRHCPGEFMVNIDDYSDGQRHVPGQTDADDACPVCVAVERAENEAQVRKRVLHSAALEPNPPPPDTGETAQVSNDRRERRHSHHRNRHPSRN